MESRPQNPEFRNNPENFHHGLKTYKELMHCPGLISSSSVACLNLVQYLC